MEREAIEFAASPSALSLRVLDTTTCRIQLPDTTYRTQLPDTATGHDKRIRVLMLHSILVVERLFFARKKLDYDKAH